mgnify:CR=1 FL=1
MPSVLAAADGSVLLGGSTNAGNSRGVLFGADQLSLARYTPQGGRIEVGGGRRVMEGWPMTHPRWRAAPRVHAAAPPALSGWRGQEDQPHEWLRARGLPRWDLEVLRICRWTAAGQFLIMFQA